jgi:hypothetical protein
VPALPFHAPGITYNGLHATTNPTAGQVAADLTTTRQHFSHVRTYYPQYGGGAVDVEKAAKDANLIALLGLFLFDGHPDWTAANYDQFVKPAPARRQHRGPPRRQRGSPNDRHHHAIPGQDESGLAGHRGGHVADRHLRST